MLMNSEVVEQLTCLIQCKVRFIFAIQLIFKYFFSVLSSLIKLCMLDFLIL